jgi:hypothetical protein
MAQGRRAKIPEDKRQARKMPPALTDADREQRLISLAMDRAEEQLLDGTASAQVICHYLKLATARDRLEREGMAAKNELMQAKTEMIKAAERSEELYANAIAAMRKYGGHSSDDEEYYDD